MVGRFEFATAGRILFGAGVSNEAGPAAAQLGRRALVTVGVSPFQVAPLLQALSEAGVKPVILPVEGEPAIELVQHGTELAHQEGCDLVIGFGGGSAMDTGKAIAAMLTNPGQVLDYLEVVGKGQTIRVPPVPMIAIPTTAGTGAEVTRNAVLAASEQHMKVSLRSPLLLPRLAIVDPELTYSLPPSVTASTGLDALTQLIEPYTSNKANPLTDAFCKEGIPLAGRSLLRAYLDGQDVEARRDMSLASLLGGLSLANAGLGGAHGFASPIGGMFNAPHGAICARMLPYVIDMNVRALMQRQPDSPVLERYGGVAYMVSGRVDVSATDAAAIVSELCEQLAVPPLSAYGITQAHVPEIVDKAAMASSMKANPIVLTKEELSEVLVKAIG